MAECLSQLYLQLCLTNNTEYIVGTNKTFNPGNALVDNTVKQVIIPYSFNGIPITEIGIDAFHSTFIETVLIFASIRQINSHAFHNCSCLRSINIPASVIYVAQRVFYLSTLKEVFIEGDSLLQYIGPGAFDSDNSVDITFCNRLQPYFKLEYNGVDHYPFSNGTNLYIKKNFSDFNQTDINIEIINDTRCLFEYRMRRPTITCPIHKHIPYSGIFITLIALNQKYTE